MAADSPLLQLRSITRRFPGVLALDSVDFDVRAGEIHALVGENGAGKSTLLSIMNGLLSPDSGDILIEGKPVVLTSPSDAIAHNFAMVHQEMVLCPNLTVAENIFLGREKQAGGNGKAQDLIRQTEALLEEIHVQLDPRTPVGELNLNEQQIVEICRALSSHPKVVVFDEPTASLNDHQVTHLLEIIAKLRERGIGIVYVSHRLQEIFEISDRITVLRDGCVVGTYQASDLNERSLVSHMVGRDYDPTLSSYRERALGDTAIELQGLSVDGVFEDVSFAARKGEIVGFAGLLGCQREAVLRTIFGTLKVDRGEIRIDGRDVDINSPYEAIENSVAFMPADRKDEGLVLGMSVADNVSLTILDKLSRFGIVSVEARREQTNQVIHQLAAKASSHGQAVSDLSGGNQQKIVIGKWIARGGDIIIAEDPTRGVDVGAKAEIWSALQALAEDGNVILLITSELEELMAASDRIIVMNRGRITGEFDRPSFDAEQIAHCFVL